MVTRCLLHVHDCRTPSSTTNVKTRKFRMDDERRWLVPLTIRRSAVSYSFLLLGEVPETSRMEKDR